MGFLGCLGSVIILILSIGILGSLGLSPLIAVIGGVIITAVASGWWETSLHPCPACRAQVSRSAQACPHCGHRLKIF